MAEQSLNDLKYGINWSFLNTLLDMYQNMISDQYIFIKSLSGNSGVNPKIAYADLVASVFTFYSATRHQFDPYLVKNKLKLKPNDFINVINTIKVSKSNQDMKKIINMTLELSNWSNSEGPFKTLTKNIDPLAPSHF